MDRPFAAGLVLVTFGLAGYGLGIVEPYPGRAFSITSLMVGITLIGVGSADGATAEDEGRSESSGAMGRGQ